MNITFTFLQSLRSRISPESLSRMQRWETKHHTLGIYIYMPVICRLWTASSGVHALLVLEPTECSASTRLGA